MWTMNDVSISSHDLSGQSCQAPFRRFQIESSHRPRKGEAQFSRLDAARALSTGKPQVVQGYRIR